MGRLRLALAIASGFLALIVAAPAGAATPFTAGTGHGQDLAVSPDGTGHVAWLTEEDPDDRVGYCRVPAGGTACDSASKFLTFPDADATAIGIDDVQIFAPTANVVVIVAACTQCPTGSVADRTYRWASMDNGATLPPSSATAIGNLAPNGQGSRLPAGGIVMVVRGSQFEAMPTPLTTTPLNLGGSSVFSPAAVPDPDGDRAVYASNDLNAVQYRFFTDPVPATAISAPELNDSSNWSIEQFLSGAEPDNQETHLSTGSRGTLLSYLSSGTGSLRVGLRQFGATNDFGPPTYVQGTNAIDQNGLNFPYHSQDGGGRIHFVWRTLHNGGRLRYTRSDDGGASFSPPANLAMELSEDPVVEAGTSGTGFAVWSRGGQVRVVPIDPQPEPSGPGPGPGGGGDSERPGVSGVGIGDSTLAPGQGTTFSFTSSEAGTATLTIEKQVPGLRIRQRGRTRCLPQNRRRLRGLRRSLSRRADVRRLRGRARSRRLAGLLRRRRCRAYKRIGRITQAVTPGRNTIVFTGRIAGRRLTPGRYRARLVVRDAAGNVSRTETIRFRVIRPRRAGRR